MDKKPTTVKDTAELVVRIDERVKYLEKRIGRIETGILGILVASLYILARAVLSSSGIPLP